MVNKLGTITASNPPRFVKRFPAHPISIASVLESCDSAGEHVLYCNMISEMRKRRRVGSSAGGSESQECTTSGNPPSLQEPKVIVS